MLFRKSITLLLAIAILTVTLSVYPMQALAKERAESAAQTGEEQFGDTVTTQIDALTIPVQQGSALDMKLKSNTEVETTAGYTHINIDDLTNGTEGMTDTDEDGLADDVEKVLGLDPESTDSDFDNLDDYFETTHGLDPLHPDTNHDGLADFYEILLTGEDDNDEMDDNDVDSDLDTDGDGTRNVDDMDNDGDGVIDGVDISPFSYGEASDEYTIDIETTGEATYVNVQIRPEDVQAMYENNQIYDWPYDTEGNIMDSDMTQEDMRILPMLEVETDNLPSEEECEKYGIILGNGMMNVMLDPVIDRGQPVAYTAKIFIPAGETTTTLKLKMAWTLQAQVDNASYRWEEMPSSYGGAKEYIWGGSTAGDINGDGNKDVVIAAIDEDSEFYYAISYAMQLDGSSDSFSGMIEVPVNMPEETGGCGVAIADLNGSGKMDIVCMAIERRDGADRFVYTIGYDIDSNGKPKEWTPLIGGPSLGDRNQGGGLSIGDLDGNGKYELVMSAIDNPDGANHFRYTIRWNFDPNATNVHEYNKDEWSDIVKTDNIGSYNQGGGVAIANIDGDNQLDLLFTCVDDPDKGNKLWYYVAYDIDTSGSDRGEYASLSKCKSYSMSLGHHSEGAGVAVSDFNKDGKDDLFLLNIDDPRGKTNNFWYWVGDRLGSDGSAYSYSDKKSISGVKGGLISSLNRLEETTCWLNGKALGLDCAVFDLDGNGIDDVHVAWINEEDNCVYLTTGWDINEDGQVRGWQKPKEVMNYGGSKGIGVEFYDVDDSGTQDLIISYYSGGYIQYRTLKNLEWRGYYKYTTAAGKSHSGTLVKLHADFNNINNLTEKKISGIGIDYVDVNDNGKVDVVVNYTKTYAYYEVTKEETTTTEQGPYGPTTQTEPEERRYYYKCENRVDVLYDVRIPNSINDDFTFSYEDRDRFVVYSYNRTKDTTDKDYKFTYESRHEGTGIEIIDLNGDDKLDALITTAVDRGKKGEFYYIIQYDFLSGDSELQVRKNNDSSNWCYYDIKMRGVGVSACDFDENNTDDAIAIAYDEEEGFRYYKTMNIETKPVPILREYETFELIGMRVEENLGADAGIVHCDLVSTEENDRKAMSVFEGLRGHFLKEEDDIAAGVQTVEDEYDISGITLMQESFDHADQVSVYIDENTQERFEDAQGTHVPVIVSITNTSRALTLDAAGSGVIRGAYLKYDLANASSQTTKLLQLQWYNADENEMIDTEALASGVDTDWGWNLGDDETKMNAIALLTHWQMGEINMTHVDNESILPDKKLWSAGWWATTLGGGASGIKDVVNYSRQGYSGMKVVTSIWKYKGGVTGFAKNMSNYYKLMNGLNVSDANVWKLKNALDVDTFTGIKGKFTSGPKITKLGKWATRAAYGVEMGLAVYRGAEIGSAYADEGTGYALYAGAVYTTLKGSYTTVLYLIPIVSKLKYGAMGTGVGAIIVALIELSDLITFLACGDSWSTMVIGKIFNALVGTNPDVEVDLNMTSSDINYLGMENGLFVVGSEIENAMDFRGTVEDIDDGHYDDKDDIDDNYAKPKVEYQTNVESIQVNNNRDTDTWYKKRDDLWWVYRDYDIDNSIEFENVGINLPVTSIFNVYYKVHIHKKGPGDDYFEKDSDKSSEKLYFDVLPMKLSEFRNGYEFDTNYENNAEVEPLDESKGRVQNNEIVIVDEDGDGLLVCGDYEKNADGDIVYSDPTKADTDGDGINDNYEDALGSDPTDTDSDNDGLNDREEMMYMTDLTDSDTDGDGLSDKEEIDGYTITVNFNGQSHSAPVHSDPLCADTDGDLVKDADEKANGTNPASMYTHGQKRWDGNDHDPEMSQPLDDINDKAIGDTITLDFDDYFTDQDGDDLTYSVDVGDLDGSEWTFTYEGGHIEVTVLAEDGRDGDHEELFIVDDTTSPYMSSTFFNTQSRNKDALDGAKNVHRRDTMNVEYNENIMFATVPTDVTLVDEHGVNIPITVTITDNVLTIDPDIELTEDYYEYTLTVPDDCIKDLSDNVTEQGYTATFVTRDIIGPRITDCNSVLGDTVPGTQVLGVGDEVTWTFHENVRDAACYPVFIGPDENTQVQWDFETTVDGEAGSVTASIKPDVLEDNTYYRFYPNVYDLRGNHCDSDFVGFTTGDVTSPDLLLAPYYTGDPQIKYMMKITSDVIEIPYDEVIFEGVNFDDIVLEDMMAQNVMKPMVSRTASIFGDPSGLVDSVVESEITTVPIDVQIVGSKLVITPEIPLVPNCVYSLVLPQDVVQDANGFNVPKLEEVHITFDSSDKPEVYASGFTTCGEVRTQEFGDIENTLGNIALVFNEGVRKTSYNSLNQITLVDSQGNDIAIWARLQEWVEEIYGADIGQVILIEAAVGLEENETYTLTMPAGVVENILGYDNTEFIETYTPTSTSIPGIEDSSFGIVGIPRVDEKAYVHFMYERYNEVFERHTDFQWYRGSTFDGADKQPITGATELGYRIGNDDMHMYLFCEVTITLTDGTTLPQVMTPGIGPIGGPYDPNNDLELLEAKDSGDVVFTKYNPSDNEYEVVVDSAMREADVTALPEADGAHVQIYIGDLEESQETSTEATVPLWFGENQVTVTVMDERGTRDQEYTLTIVRDRSDEHLFPPEGYCEIRPDTITSSGSVYVGTLLYGDTYYYDDEKRSEGASNYRWYRSANRDGSDKTLVAQTQDYTSVSQDKGSYIFFEYTAVSDSGVAGVAYLTEPVKIAGESSGSGSDEIVPDSEFVSPDDDSVDTEEEAMQKEESEEKVPGTGDEDSAIDGIGDEDGVTDGAAELRDADLTQGGNGWLWYAIGCGALVLCAMSTGIWMLLRRRRLVGLKTANGEAGGNVDGSVDEDD